MIRDDKAISRLLTAAVTLDDAVNELVDARARLRSARHAVRAAKRIAMAEAVRLDNSPLSAVLDDRSIARIADGLSIEQVQDVAMAVSRNQGVEL